jgi:hypothetical protein
MDALTAVMAGALTTAIVGGLVGYVLGYRKTQWERLYEQRAEVIAELSRLLWRFQDTALRATNPDRPQARAQKIAANEQAYDDLQNHFFGHTAWLSAEVREIMEMYLKDMAITLGAYNHDLNEEGQPSTDIGDRAAKRIFDTVSLVRHDLDNAFRDILYPPEWHERPLQWLAWLDAKLKRRE